MWRNERETQVPSPQNGDGLRLLDGEKKTSFARGTRLSGIQNAKSACQSLLETKSDFQYNRADGSCTALT